MTTHVRVMYIVGDLILTVTVLFHDFMVSIVVRVYLFSLALEHIYMNLGIENTSSLSYSRYLVSLYKRENRLVAHLVFLLQLLYSIVVSSIELCYELCKMQIYQSFVKVGVPALIYLRDVIFLYSGSYCFL